MTTELNPKTGLKERFHPFYKIPEVQQRNINTVRLDGQPRAVHTVPLPNSLTLDFFIQTGKSDVLFVAFHGANMTERNMYPRFERVQSLRKVAPALIAFADPTIMVDRSREMLLSWYLGGPGWDPMNEITKVIRKAMGKTGSKRVVFVGGSGGGYAALRASAMTPGSLAFVQAPQTSIARYIPHVVKTYLDVVWPGWPQKELLEAFPERFDMVRHYQMRQPDNFVYYMQSRSDPSHVENHYGPFKAVHGVQEESGVSRSGRQKFVMYDGEVRGHGTILPHEFDFHLGEAMRFYDGQR